MKPIPVEAFTQYTEAQCAVAFNCTIQQVRKAKRRAKLTLAPPCEECLKEMAILYADQPAQQVARLYFCDINDVLKARYRPKKVRHNNQPSLDEIRPWLAAGFSEESIASALKCSKRHVRARIKEDPILSIPVHSQLAAERAERIRQQLALGYTQAETAAAFNISQTAVSKCKLDKVKRAPYNRLSPERWEQLLSSLAKKEFTIAELAAFYKVNRSAIYQKLRSKENA